ncbi:MAG: glycosyltransferase family 39 protein, partial [Patescibacteria group bacterium]
MRRLRTHWVLLSVTCIGVFLRFTNLNWDLGSRLHPDEALIVNGSLAITFFSQLSPGFHDYNGLSVYLLKAASLIASFLFRSPYWSVTPEGVTVVGRFVSALLSSLAIPLLYILGKQLWKKETGIIAATLLAFTPLLIQLAHFYTTESMLIFLELLLLFAILRYARDPNRHSLVRMSIPVGLLLATKNTAYLFVPIPIAAIIVSNQQAYGKVRALALFLIVSI